MQPKKANLSKASYGTMPHNAACMSARRAGLGRANTNNNHNNTSNNNDDDDDDDDDDDNNDDATCIWHGRQCWAGLTN